MLLVISYFILFLKRNFINVIWAIILNYTFQFHFSWIIKTQEPVFHFRTEVNFFWITQFSILQGIIFNYQNCFLTRYFFLRRLTALNISSDTAESSQMNSIFTKSKYVLQWKEYIDLLVISSTRKRSCLKVLWLISHQISTSFMAALERDPNKSDLS